MRPAISLCQLAGSWNGQDPPPGALCEEKHDGWRATRLRGVTGSKELFTRNGMVIHGTGHIHHFLEAMERAAGCEMVFDGEFVVDDGQGDTLASTKRWCESGWKQGGEAGKLYLFDCLTQAEWRAGGSPTPLMERKTRLNELHAAALADLGDDWTWREGSRGSDAHMSAVELVAFDHVFTYGDVIESAGKVWARGGEGVVLKDMTAPYQRRRSADWLKVGRPWLDRLGWKVAA